MESFFEKRDDESISIRVDGPGAWAKLKGKSTFKMHKLESSKTYNKMQKKYKIGAGISGFFKWIGLGRNSEKYKEEIRKTLNELSDTQMYNGSVDIDMYVSGSIPGFEVTATAYIFVMNFEDSYGNKYTVTSGQQPKDNTGGADDNGNSLPQKGNNSTIII